MINDKKQKLPTINDKMQKLPTIYGIHESTICVVCTEMMKIDGRGDGGEAVTFHRGRLGFI